MRDVKRQSMRSFRYLIFTLGIIVVFGTALFLMIARLRSSVDGTLFFIAKQNGYYGLYEYDGRSGKKIFNSGDILEAYPNLAIYHISYDVSEDGRYVAYSAVNVLGDADIFLYDRESGQTSNLSRDTHTDSYPVFSHDGEYIAYLSHEKSGRRYDEIILIKSEGSERVRLTNLLLRISSLSFSPDNGSILFTKHLGDRSSIASLDIATGEIKELLGPFCYNTSPSFDSRGKRITYISDCHGSLDVWIMNSDGTDRKPLYKGTGEEHEPYFIGSDESVAFVSVSEQTEDGAPLSFSLLSVGLDGGEVKNLMPDRYRNRQIFMTHLDIPDPQNRIYFQGKLLDSRRRSRYMVFTLDTEKHFLKRTGLRGIDMLNPIIR